MDFFSVRRSLSASPGRPTVFSLFKFYSRILIMKSKLFMFKCHFILMDYIMHGYIFVFLSECEHSCKLVFIWRTVYVHRWSWILKTMVISVFISRFAQEHIYVCMFMNMYCIFVCTFWLLFLAQSFKRFVFLLYNWFFFSCKLRENVSGAESNCTHSSSCVTLQHFEPLGSLFNSSSDFLHSLLNSIPIF